MRGPYPLCLWRERPVRRKVYRGSWGRGDSDRNEHSAGVPAPLPLLSPRGTAQGSRNCDRTRVTWLVRVSAELGQHSCLLTTATAAVTMSVPTSHA